MHLSNIVKGAPVSIHWPATPSSGTLLTLTPMIGYSSSHHINTMDNKTKGWSHTAWVAPICRSSILRFFMGENGWYDSAKLLDCASLLHCAGFPSIKDSPSWGHATMWMPTPADHQLYMEWHQSKFYWAHLNTSNAIWHDVSTYLTMHHLCQPYIFWPVHLMKVDLADGYYWVPISPSGMLQLGVILPICQITATL